MPRGRAPSPVDVVLDRWWVPLAQPDWPPVAPARRALNAIARATAALGLRDAGFTWERADRIARITVQRMGVEVCLGHRQVPYALTFRELEVLTILALGLTNAEIADRLGIARRTASTHVERALAKLAVASRTAAAILVVNDDLAVLPLPGGVHQLPDLPLVRLAAAASGLRDGGMQRGSDGPSTGAVGRAFDHRRPIRLHPILIGGLYPVGPVAGEDGRTMRAGAELAVAVVNRAGGVHGRGIVHCPVAVDIGDPKSIDDGLSRLFAAGVDAVTLGYTFARSSKHLAHLFDRISDYGAPLLHSQTSKNATALVSGSHQRYRSIFQVCAPETRYGLGFVRFVDELAASGSWRPARRTLAVIDSTNPDLQAWSADAGRLAEALGWRVAEPILVDPFRPDWWDTLTRLHAGQTPAAVLVACFVPDVLVDFLRVHATQPLRALLYATYVPSVSGFLARAGSSAEGLVWSTVTGTKDGPATQAFSRAYRDRHGHDPGLSSAGTHFDMVRLLAEAWTRADSPLDRRSVVAHLARSLHLGINGLYAFDRTDQSVRAYPDDTPDPLEGKAHLVFQVNRGRHQLIAPTPYGPGRLVVE